MSNNRLSDEETHTKILNDHVEYILGNEGFRNGYTLFFRRGDQEKKSQCFIDLEYCTLLFPKSFLRLNFNGPEYSYKKYR